MENEEFQKFSKGLKRLIFSFIPCFVIFVILTVFVGLFSLYQEVLITGFSLHVVWDVFFNSFGLLLTATAVWMFASIWLSIFILSRQPLDVKLSSETLERFRELSLLALWFSLFYFVGVSIGNITYFTDTQGFSVSSLFLSPYLLFIIIGVLGILLPFYNIHTVLLKMKKEELTRISMESEMLVRQLDEELNNLKTSQQISGKIKMIHYRLFNLQIKEKYVKVVNEWPIDITFVSKLLALVLIPIISKVLVMLFLS
jgi:hypothetical protein